jgi:hypothetical protein
VRCDGVVVDVLGGLRRPRNKTFPISPPNHLPNVPLTDTALIARTDALVQWWWLMSAAAPAIGRWAKRSLARLKGFEAADLDKMV